MCNHTGIAAEDGIDEEEKEHYFFTRCQRKERAGNRADRSAGSGFWKVTRGDKQVLDSQKRPINGVKRCLIFKCGRDKLKTKVKNESKNWIMHEFRLSSAKVSYALF